MKINMNFERGELAPHLSVNKALIQTTAASIKNLTVSQNGGLAKRAGLKYLKTLDEYGKIIPFNNICLVLTNKKITAFDDTGKTIATTTSPYFMEHLDSIDFVVNNNKLYLAEKNYNLMIIEFKNDLLILQEQTFKNLNEYPAHITFYENRFVVAGTNINPSKIYMSKIGDYFNFDIGSAMPDEAIELYLTAGDETITGIVASNNLQVFTKDSEWKVSGFPMTPQTVTVTKQSSYGSNGTKPVVIGGTTIFIPKKTGGLRNFIYSDQYGGYISQNLCEFAPHLLDNVSQIAAVNDKIFLLSTNHITIATILKNHLAFTKVKTNGTFISIGAVKDTVFTIVKRNGNFILEMFDETCFMDSFVNLNFETPTKNITGLSHLKNKQVTIVTDDNFYNKTVDGNGNLELVKPVTKVTIGLLYEYLLLPNNLLNSDLVLNNGFKLQDLKLNIKTAKSFEIDTGNGFETIDFQYDRDSYDYTKPPTEIKGVIKITGGSWNFDTEDNFFLLKGGNPYDFKIIGIAADIQL